MGRGPIEKGSLRVLYGYRSSSDSMGTKVERKTRIREKMMCKRHTKTKISLRCSYKLLINMGKEVKTWSTTCYPAQGR